MTHRERVIEALNHRQPDRVPIDFGGTGQTGISASTLYKLRQVLELPERRIKIIEPFQLLGEVEEDLLDYFDVDVVGLWNRGNLFGLVNDDWQPWEMPDGTPVLMPGGFEYDVTENGDTLVYPQGDRSVKPSLRLPKGGYFFDNINRAPEVDENNMDARRDFADLYPVFSDEDALYLEREAERLRKTGDRAVIYNFNGGGFGDAAIVPGPYEKHPRGIRKLEEWYMAHYLYPDYLKELFDFQTEVALKNLEFIRQAVGDRIDVINISCTDFGSQNGELISLEQFREFYLPHYRELNGWVHQNTPWKVHFHCCGSITKILDDFSGCGVDVLNPVQWTAQGMDPKMLKEQYGDAFTFWGGGIDTQKTLPFGTPEEVKAQVREKLDIFAPGGGFVFNTIHNILGKTPPENVIAMFDALKDFAPG